MERFFEWRRSRQARKQLITELGIEDILKQEFIGPEDKKATVARIERPQFAQLLRDKTPAEILSTIVHRGNTHAAYALYMEVGYGIWVKTSAIQLEFALGRTILTDLNELGYQHEPIESKTSWVPHSWSTYKRQEITIN